MLSQNDCAPGMVDLPTEDVFFGESPAMQAVRQKIGKLANTDVSLLIQGDSGTGKEVLGRLIHARSSWSRGSFVKVNCTAIPGALVESELFGYEKGAFTGAQVSKPGRVEMGEGGTLFLDGIGELDLSLQAKLLQFLQDGQFCRIGDHEERHVKTRVICATSRELEVEIESGKFRPDLYYRINVIQLKLPRLRDRREDIPYLANYFLSVSSARFQLPAPSLSREITQVLQQREWPGNIRELENCMARCVILGAEDALETYLRAKRPGALSMGAEADGSIPLKRIAERARRELERDVILKTLEVHNWNRRKTAEALKISYRTLLNKVREAGILSMRQQRKFYRGNDPDGHLLRRTIGQDVDKKA